MKMKSQTFMFLAYLVLSVVVLSNTEAKSFKGAELNGDRDFRKSNSVDRLISYFKVQNDRLLADEAVVLKNLFLANFQKRYSRGEPSKQIEERFLPCASEEVMDPLSGC